VPVRGERTTSDPQPERSSDFLHELRNRLFALSALFDVLELRAGASAEVARYLPHLRLELGRLEHFAGSWQHDALGPGDDTPSPTLLAVLAGAIESVSETAALRDVLVSLGKEPDSGRVARSPGLVSAALTLLLDDAVRLAPQGAHLVLRAARTGREESHVQMRCDGILEFSPPAFELARAVLRSLGGELVAARGDHGGTTLTARIGVTS
jgi:signal transduction histidine kinase